MGRKRMFLYMNRIKRNKRLIWMSWMVGEEKGIDGGDEKGDWWKEGWVKRNGGKNEEEWNKDKR